MRKIWPSYDNCIQLKDKFASCEFGTPTCEIKAYLAKWKWNTAAQSQRSPTCESDFATCELGAQRAKMDSKLQDFCKSPCDVRNLCTNWDICAPTLLDLFFRYFCINFHSSPYNPPIIRFLS